MPQPSKSPAQRTDPAPRTPANQSDNIPMLDVLIIGAALLVVPVWSVVLSAAGAVVLNLVLALNHRPGRYIGH